jgi:RNA polymerase sigma-70 factor (family 1)
MSSHSDFNEDEKLLITRLMQGDMAAFDQLYWHYQKAVYQNAFKLTQNTQIAEDIVQEVFISLWEKRQSIDSSRSVGGWLFVSSYNRSVNALKKKLRESLALKEIGQTEDQDNPDISEIQYSILEKAIAALSPQKRKVFELCKLKGHSYEEAAKEMNISKHTVKEYLASAISFIKEYAEKQSTAGMIAALFFNLL